MADQPWQNPPEPLRSKRAPIGQRPGDDLGSSSEQVKSPRTESGSRPLPKQGPLGNPPALREAQGSGLRVTPSEYHSHFWS